MHWTEILALVIVTIAVGIPLALAAPMIFGIISAWRDHRPMEARRATTLVPGLGQFTSTGNDLWFGESQGITITLTCAGTPPGGAHAAQAQNLLAELPRLAEECRRYLAAHEDCSRLEGGPGRIRRGRTLDS